jgi:predicted MFS family arabinose efflux permease
MIHQEVAKPLPQQQVSPEKKAVEVPKYAWVILAVAFISSVAAPLNQFKVPPVMPVLMEAFKLSMSSAGWLMSVFSITGFLLALPAGLILLRLGLKVTGLIAMGVLVVGSVLGALSSTAGVMLFSRVIEGVGMGLIAVVAPASIGMWFPREKQGVPMGLWATWVPVGSVIMFILAPALASAFGWQSIWWFGAAFALLAFVLVWLFMRMPPQMAAPGPAAGGAPAGEPPNLRKALSNPSIWLLGAMFGFFNLALIALNTFFPTFLFSVRSYSMASASFTVSLVMITVLFSAPLAGVLSDKIGSRKLVFTVPFIIVAIMMIFPFTISGGMIALWMILLGVVAGAIPTATFAAAPEIMKKPELVGMGMAVVALGQNLGMFIGPVIFGAVVASSGWAAAGYVMIPVLLLGLVSGLLVKVR